MSLVHGVVDRVPVYERATGDVLRALNPTEHNMERLNARARGSGRTYHTVVLEGPLSHAALEQALDRLVSRHPLLRVRIVQGEDGTLFYAPTRGAREGQKAPVPVSYTLSDDLSRWPELVEADMNAGAIASDSGPLFGFAVIEPPGLEDGASGRRVLVMAGHHAVCDATSSVALMHELFEQLARPHPVSPLEASSLVDPFCLEVPVPELAGIEAKARAALESRDPGRTDELAALHARFEALEQRLLAARDGEGRLPVALKAVHGWLSSLGAELRPARGIVPELEVAGSDRYERVRTALLHRTLDVEPTRALRRVAKAQGLTLHGAFSAAVLVALAAERAAEASASARSTDRLALASAVSFRKQLVPPLLPHDLRMIVDILVSRVPVKGGDRFWDLARIAGQDVTRAVGNYRALSSSFRTARRSFEDTPPGLPMALLSNLGKAELSPEYGPFKVLELAGSMTTHGSFQLAMLFLSFDEHLSMSFYAETPTVSRTTLERFSARVLETLRAVASGDEPTAPG